MAIIASDDFSGTTVVNLHNRTTTTGGRIWACAAVSTSLKLNGAGALRSTTSSGAVGRVDLGTSDHWSRALTLAFGANPGAAVVVRAVDLSNFIGLRALDANSVEIFKRVGSTTDQRVALIGGLALTLPVALELRIAGTVARALVNGVPVGAAGGYTIADAVFTGVNLAGLFARGSALDPALDDWAGGDVVSPAVALGPEGGRCETRGRPAALLLAAPAIGPAATRVALRGGPAALAFSPAAGALAGTGSRITLRGSATGLTVVTPPAATDVAIIHPVPADMRIRPVWRD